MSVTINTLIKKGRKKGKKSRGSVLLRKSGQRKVVCVAVKIENPCKPNSASRKTAKVRLRDGRETSAYIPGEGHNIQPHSLLLIRGKGVKDLRGVNYTVVRGALDCAGVAKRKNGRSKYGTRKV